ncbi:hypothetical protein BDW74DRAFT_172656 [Aspergillus multicolor]|uniref:uncharacterized protein n=1 Tax=Aspergillus multicolor TaxID=41759 RepID=UPI003CCD72C9
MHLLTPITVASASLFSILSLALGATSLAEYLKQRSYLVSLVPKADINDIAYIGATSYNICCSTLSIFAPTITIWFIRPLSQQSTAIYPYRLRIALGALALTAVLGLVNALILTIITATKSVSFGDSVGPRVTAYLGAAADAHGTPVLYRRDAVAIATVVFAWLGTGCSLIG